MHSEGGRAIGNIAEQTDTDVAWVPGHGDVERNERAEAVAEASTGIEQFHADNTLSSQLAVIRHVLIKE